MYSQALPLTAGIIITPSPKNYPRGRACKKKSKKNSQYSHKVENEPFRPLNIAENTRLLPKTKKNVSSQLESSTKTPYSVSHLESSLTSPESSVNQNRVLRHPSRQSIRIEYHVIGVVSQPE